MILFEPTGNGDERPGSRVKVVAPDVVAFKGAIHVRLL